MVPSFPVSPVLTSGSVQSLYSKLLFLVTVTANDSQLASAKILFMYLILKSDGGQQTWAIVERHFHKEKWNTYTSVFAASATTTTTTTTTSTTAPTTITTRPEERHDTVNTAQVFRSSRIVPGSYTPIETDLPRERLHSSHLFYCRGWVRVCA